MRAGVAGWCAQDASLTHPAIADERMRTHVALTLGDPPGETTH